MKILFLFLLLGIGQASFAERLYEVDIAKCGNVEIYTGDTLRFINHSKRTIYLDAEIFNYGIPPGEYFNYTFTNELTNRYLFSEAHFKYTCKTSDLESETIANSNIIFHPKPIDIYPKKNIISIEESFDIGIYILANKPDEYAQNIKKIEITVDGSLFFNGNITDYKKLITKQNTYGLNYVYIDGTFAPPIIYQGYSVTRYHVAAGAFQKGIHVVRAKITLETNQGNVDYEEKGEFFIS